MKKAKQKFEIPWWDKWYNADLLKRQEMVAKLPLVSSMPKLLKLPEKVLSQKQKILLLSTALNSYFEDLTEYMEARSLKEK